VCLLRWGHQGLEGAVDGVGGDGLELGVVIVAELGEDQVEEVGDGPADAGRDVGADVVVEGELVGVGQRAQEGVCVFVGEDVERSRTVEPSRRVAAAS